MNLVNTKKMMLQAQAEKYAVAHFNINNLEWTRALLEVAQETNTAIILGVSEGAIKYMGGYQLVVNMVCNLMAHLNITVPIVLHLDHGQSYASCEKALKAGFTSVMFDGSHLSFSENLAITKKVVALAQSYGASVEAEAGSIGGEEDGVIGCGAVADVAECQQLVATGIDILAAAINNIHGNYPNNWKGLNFITLQEIAATTKKPLVLHGGSGIPLEQIKKAINLGVCKINCNTELQIAFAQALRSYITNNMDQQDKGFDPRKIFRYGIASLKEKAIALLKAFGSYGRV